MTTIRTAGSDDAAAIVAIYNHYVRSTAITFEEEDVAVADMAGRIDEVIGAGLPYVAACRDGRVIGYAYASKWKGRCAYRFSVEVSVYLAAESVGAGAGSALYRELFDRLARQRIHVAIAGIALPNDASIALHEKFGMRKVAHFQQVGFKFGRWIDVAYWQRILGD